MNDPNPFETLALLDALGEATPDQQATLRDALAKDVSLAARHATLTRDVRLTAATYGTGRPKKPDPEEDVPIPASVLARLEAARSKSFARREKAVPSNVIAFQNVSPKQTAAAASQRKAAAGFGAPRRMLPAWMARAAVIAVLGAISAYWYLRPQGGAPAKIRGAGSIPIASAALAPRGATGVTRPLIVWDNHPGQNYDVWILPPEGKQTEAPALFIAKNVRSPLAFAELKPTKNAAGLKELEPGKDYRLLVCFASLGKLAGVTVPFHTTSEAEGELHLPPSAAALVLKAKLLLEAGKPGDALMVLQSLPEDQRSTPEVSAIEQEAKGKLPAPAGPLRGTP